MTRHRVVLSNRGDATFDVAEDEAILDVCEQAGVILPVACRSIATHCDG
jgi:ferredoxin